MMENLESQKLVSVGGLNSNINHLYLSDNEPGAAVELINFETSLSGGYRRLSGFAALSDTAVEVDPAGAEGRILGIAIKGSIIMAARKQKSGNTYAWYSFTGSTWNKLTTTFTLNSLGVTRIRYVTLNFNGTEKIVFVDGINPATIYDGTNWGQIKASNTGADLAHAGGNQAVDAPKYVEVFKNHLFLAQDSLVVHSAPLAEYDFTVASGAGQLPAGYIINNIKTFRDTMVVFGMMNIKQVNISGDSFVLNEVTNNIGCIAPDSVQEFNGSLIFMSQDGIRPFSGTDRINDVELETISRKIQSTYLSSVNSSSLTELNSVVIRGKSQIRFFFSDPAVSRNDTYGIIGCIRSLSGEGAWEWGQIKGIRTSCVISKYIGASEFVIHGDYDGKVYRQEVGNTFDGQPITAVYTTPYLDFGATGNRKTMHKLKLFLKPEGRAEISAKLTYDWMDPEKLNPDIYDIDVGTTSTISIYGVALWNSGMYSHLPIPVSVSNVQGSGYSVQVSFSTSDTNPPYTIQGALFEFNVEGKK